MSDEVVVETYKTLYPTLVDRLTRFFPHQRFLQRTTGTMSHIHFLLNVEAFEPLRHPNDGSEAEGGADGTQETLPHVQLPWTEDLLPRTLSFGTSCAPGGPNKTRITTVTFMFKKTWRHRPRVQNKVLTDNVTWPTRKVSTARNPLVT